MDNLIYLHLVANPAHMRDHIEALEARVAELERTARERERHLTENQHGHCDACMRALESTEVAGLRKQLETATARKMELVQECAQLTGELATARELLAKAGA
jgi:hypothetical protein